MSDGTPRRFSAVQGSRRILAVAFCFSAAVNVLMLTGPLFMLLIYDRVLRSKSEESLVALVVLVVAIYFFMWLIDFARGRLISRAGSRLQSQFGEQAFQAEIEASPENKPRFSPTRDLRVLRDFLASPTCLAALDTPFTPIFLLAIFAFHPLLGWLALAGAMLLVLTTLLNRAVTKSSAKTHQGEVADALRFADNVRQARSTVTGQAMLGATSLRWHSMNEKIQAKATSGEDFSAALSALTKSLRLLLQSLLLALGAWLVLQNELTAGAMIAASILLGRALSPTEVLLSRWAQVQQALMSWSNLGAHLNTRPARTLAPLPGLKSSTLQMRGVTVSRGPGTSPVLYNVSFEIIPGKALGVIGRSGAGKSTLARVLLNQVTPTVGEARIGGALISQLTEDSLGRTIGYLPQNAELLTGSLLENIAHMELEPNLKKATAAAITAGAHELILSLPDGYETRVFDNNGELSGGQIQRIALARALYHDPMLLVLDEPNSALDRDGTEALNAAIRQYKARGRSVLVMTHRPMAISECDTLMVLDRGAPRTLGPRDEVLRTLMANAEGISAIRGNEVAS